jgi:serine O-acetyltransferase
VNQFKPKDSNYDLIFNPNMIDFEKIVEADKKLIAKFNEEQCPKIQTNE